MRDFLRAAYRSVHAPISQAEEIIGSFTASGRILFFIFGSLCVISSIGLLYILNKSTLIAVPSHGGNLSEGIIGSPRFINPVLAISDADHDLTALTYSGLLKRMPSGAYIPDLASDYSVSSDGLTYTATLRPGGVFSDGTPVTADDIIFTIQKAQDPALKSPLRVNWTGVTVQKIGDRTVQFSLRQPYAPFIQNLTVGILPQHLWNKVSDDSFPFSNLNVNPVGSGPYLVSSIRRSADGIASSYSLSTFSKYVLGVPYLSSLTLKFYQGESSLHAALKSGEIESAGGLSPETLSDLSGFHILRAPLTRVYGVFFNQGQSPALQDKAVRQALNEAISRTDLINQVLHGYGTAVNGPLPSNVDVSLPQDEVIRIAAAKQTLLAAGWTPGPEGVLQKTIGSGKNTSTQTLTFSISTGDTLELRSAAQYLKDTWSKIGARVDVKIFNQGDLSQSVIRPRSYNALLFGEVVGQEPDLYAFWSSAERNDPGLNIALYANPAADTLLSQLRQTSDPATKQKLYDAFNQLLAKDIPAIFLYTPDFVYSVPNDLERIALGSIDVPSDRFLSITSWHRQTEYVWPWFAPGTPK